jgi:hypothetical protein
VSSFDGFSRVVATLEEAKASTESEKLTHSGII